MTPVVDLDVYELDPLMAYGGAAGQKQALRRADGLWMVKYPESTKDFVGKVDRKGKLPSYTTSPLSEYIGSHIYESLGIPVHETVLGRRAGKIAVACKDFAIGSRIIDFASIKNTMSDESLQHGTSSGSHGDFLADVLKVINEAPIFEGIREEVRARFWDMFVTDAFILNNDRNNGNWGLLPVGSKPILAPVYDNGQAFFNKKTTSAMGRTLERDAVWGDVNASRSFYLAENGNHIKPFRFLSETDDGDAVKALARFVAHIDFERVRALIEDIPETAFGLDVLPPLAREFYSKAALDSLTKGIIPAARAQDIKVPAALDALAK